MAKKQSLFIGRNPEQDQTVLGGHTAIQQYWHPITKEQSSRGTCEHDDNPLRMVLVSVTDCNQTEKLKMKADKPRHHDSTALALLRVKECSLYSKPKHHNRSGKKGIIRDSDVHSVLMLKTFRTRVCKCRSSNERWVSASSGFSQGQSQQTLTCYIKLHFPACDSVQCPLTVPDYAQPFIHLH